VGWAGLGTYPHPRSLVGSGLHRAARRIVVGCNVSQRATQGRDLGGKARQNEAQLAFFRREPAPETTAAEHLSGDAC
jgi:hypothetical protein